jgi:hypothetical protein
MGHIQKRAERKYRARWLDPDGRERSKTFTRRSDAERHLAAVEGAKLAGAYIDLTRRTPVAQYARQWAATRPHRSTTATRVASLIGKHIDGTSIGAQRLVAVRPPEVQAVGGGPRPRALSGDAAAPGGPSPVGLQRGRE